MPGPAARGRRPADAPAAGAFDGLRCLIRHGVPWHALPNDLPPWRAVHDQAQRWLHAGCFEMLAHDLRAVLRLAAGREQEPWVRAWDCPVLVGTESAFA